MSIPDFQSLMLPALTALSSRKETSISDVRRKIADAEGLTRGQMRQLLPSGRQPVFDNRVQWAMQHLKHARLVENVRRGIWRLTDDGKRLLDNKPTRVDLSALKDIPAYAERQSQWQSSKASRSGRDEVASTPSEGSWGTPDESLGHAVRELRVALEAEVLDRIREAAPEFLERVIVDLLIEMGYGGGDPTRGQVTGGTGDGGIDGRVQQDVLGLDEVYVQAKKYAEGRTVGVGDILNFVGALAAANTDKGVFVTTTGFTRGAREQLEKSKQRIVLIDGKKLARLLVEHGVGVRTKTTHVIKQIDEDYFS